MQVPASKHSDWRLWLLCAVAVTVCVAVAMRGPIPQAQEYHRFADDRLLLGLPNFWNVASNLPFLIFGLWGLRTLGRDPEAGRPLRPVYAVFFLGSSLVAVGSSWYHYSPTDASLIWDRLPMTLAFMAFFAAIVGRHIDVARALRALVPLLLVGLASVGWWAVSGDLRPYLLVQFLPILLIPLILLLFPARAPGTGFVWVVLGVYVLAKLLEIYDVEVFRTLGVSGHSLKHLAAAIGVGCVVRLVRARG